jgi:hypothetical protein
MANQMGRQTADVNKCEALVIALVLKGKFSAL